MSNNAKSGIVLNQEEKLSLLKDGFIFINLKCIDNKYLKSDFTKDKIYLHRLTTTELEANSICLISDYGQPILDVNLDRFVRVIN